MIDSQNISPALRFYRKTAAQNVSNGLTTRGAVRQRPENNGRTRAKLTARRERGLTAWNDRVMRLRAQGLTTRGGRRIYAVGRGDALLLKASIDAVAAALGEVFEQLPPTAQFRVLELEKHLSGIRRQTI